MLNKVTNYINDNKLIEKQDKVLIALSGCLLYTSDAADDVSTV